MSKSTPARGSSDTAQPRASAPVSSPLAGAHPSPLKPVGTSFAAVLEKLRTPQEE